MQKQIWLACHHLLTLKGDIATREVGRNENKRGTGWQEAQIAYIEGGWAQKQAKCVFSISPSPFPGWQASKGWLGEADLDLLVGLRWTEAAESTDKQNCPITGNYLRQWATWPTPGTTRTQRRQPYNHRNWTLPTRRASLKENPVRQVGIHPSGPPFVLPWETQSRESSLANLSPLPAETER